MILDDILELENQKIVPDELVLSETYDFEEGAEMASFGIGKELGALAVSKKLASKIKVIDEHYKKEDSKFVPFASLTAKKREKINDICDDFPALSESKKELKGARGKTVKVDVYADNIWYNGETPVCLTTLTGGLKHKYYVSNNYGKYRDYYKGMMAYEDCKKGKDWACSDASLLTKIYKGFSNEKDVSESVEDFEEGTNELSKHQISSLKHKLSKIVRLNKILTKFDVVNSGQYLSPDEFEKTKSGMSWDYAEYQYQILKKSGYNVINFYLKIDDKNHAFTVVKFKEFYIYMESFIKRIAGVYCAKHINDVFQFVIDVLTSEHEIKDGNYEIHSYTGYENYGCDINTFIDHMINNEKLIVKGRMNANLKGSSLQRFDESVEDDFLENYIISEKDIYYNKEKFDSGEIRLCCITGLCGSGKTTMGNSIGSSAEIEHYGLDDVVFNFDYTDSDLKEFGDLIYSFFNGVGKEFRYHSEEELYNDKRWQMDDFNKGYEYSITRKFVEYSKKYVAVHKNKKIVLDGIWFFYCIKPSEIDDCAVYIKGTSLLISNLRAAKRDSKSKIEELTRFFKYWKKDTWSEKQIREYRDYFLNKEKSFSESIDDISEELLLMEAAIEHTFLLKGVVEKSIFSVLGTPEGRRKYKRIQDEYINRNMDKLSTAGPMYLIVFGDNDQKAYLDLFGIKKEDIVSAMTAVTKQTGSVSDFKFFRNNPILVVLYFCIRYFTLEDDKQGINATLAIFALGIYWSKFTKYFPKGVIGPVMEYTIDNMTEKFMIKKCGNIFNTLVTSINQSYQFHKKRFYEGGDDDATAFMQRISNDQNSLLKKIANEYNKNYKEGKAVSTRNDDYDPDNPIVDDIQNASTIIQNQVSKVTLPIISNGVDLVLAECAARMSGISISDCREYLTKIMVQKNLPALESLIESILFMFIYTYGKATRDIKSQYFLAWARALFKKTNSNDQNLKNINTILEKWAEESGIYARYKREGSRINYKKGIFFYVILSIQKYS